MGARTLVGRLAPGGRTSPARSGRRALVHLRGAAWALRLRVLRLRGPGAAARALLRAHPLLCPRILRALGAEIGEGAALHPPLHVMNAGRDFSRLSVGRDAWLGPDVLLDLTAPVRIGDRAVLSARTSLVTHRNLGASRLRRDWPPVAGPVSIGDDAYLGLGAVVLHDVSVGEGSLVAAGSLVRADVPAGALVAGIPAVVRGRASKDADR